MPNNCDSGLQRLHSPSDISINWLDGTAMKAFTKGGVYNPVTGIIVKPSYNTSDGFARLVHFKTITVIFVGLRQYI